jgi:subtilase family serine protease
MIKSASKDRCSGAAFVFLILGAVVAAFAVAAPADAQVEPPGWAATATQAMPLSGVSQLQHLAASTPLHIAVGLKVRNKAQLDQFVAEVSRPGSPSFGRVLNSQEFLESYAPTAAQAQSVLDYLGKMGFTGLELSPNRLVIGADGTAGAAEKAFNTELVQFPLAGKLVFANRLPVQVPAALSAGVAGVLGLHNLSTTHTMLELAKLAGKEYVHPAARRPLLSAALALPQLLPSFNAAAFRTTYDVGATPTGAGTPIGIVAEGDLTQVTVDLRQYEKENGLVQVPVEVVHTGPVSSDISGIDEFDLDSQTSTGMAENVRNLVLYDAPTLNDADLILAYERIVSDDKVKAVNMSFGTCELFEYLSGGMLLADLAFETGVAEGISFFAATGDAGAACAVVASLGLPDAGIVGVVSYPASSPYVVAVGGTTLLVDGSYNYLTEIAWIAGGGGISLWENAPSWQHGVAPLAGSLLALRGVPDIAMDADAYLSPAVVVINGADTGIGGTSLSSPLAVGVWARMQTAHQNCYGFAAPILYSFISGELKAPADFHDITLGTNGLFVATTGWDFTTGIGSFDVAKVNSGLPAVSCSP